MNDQRFIIEMGMGTDMAEMNYQAAARQAINDAYSHVTIPMWDSLGIDPRKMRLVVTVGVQDPAQVDASDLATLIPRGTVEVRVVQGGQNVVNPENGTAHVVATAAVEAFLPYQGEGWVGRTS